MWWPSLHFPITLPLSILWIFIWILLDRIFISGSQQTTRFLQNKIDFKRFFHLRNIHWPSHLCSGLKSRKSCMKHCFLDINTLLPFFRAFTIMDFFFYEKLYLPSASNFHKRHKITNSNKNSMHFILMQAQSMTILASSHKLSISWKHM